MARQHWETLLLQRAYGKARYREMKAHGLCPRCKQDNDRRKDNPKSAYCSKCKGCDVGKTNREARTKWFDRQVKRGLCGRCGKRERTVGRAGRASDYCDRCLKQQRVSAMARWRKTHQPKRANKCRLCRGGGHNAATCPMRFGSIVQYATARPGAGI